MRLSKAAADRIVAHIAATVPGIKGPGDVRLVKSLAMDREAHDGFASLPKNRAAEARSIVEAAVDADRTPKARARMAAQREREMNRA